MMKSVDEGIKYEGATRICCKYLELKLCKRLQEKWLAALHLMGMYR